VWTICLHPNTADALLYDQVRHHLESGATVISYGQAREIVARAPGNVANLGFKAAYALHIWRYKRRSRSLAAAM
jgi:hypothetical protein